MACSGNPILGDPETVSRVGINGAREPERTGERARGMLLLTNQFHHVNDSLECLSLIMSGFSQSEARIYRTAFVIFLYEGVYL